MTPPPEGFTPPPYMEMRPDPRVADSRVVDSRESLVGSRSFVAAISTILGIVIGIGIIIGVLGRAFYVDRSEYTNQLLRDAEERANVENSLKRLDAMLERQESVVEKLSDVVETLKIETSTRVRR